MRDYLDIFLIMRLGNLYNSQMLHTMEEQIPEWEDHLRQGKFSEIKQWLITNVHQVRKYVTIQFPLSKIYQGNRSILIISLIMPK